MDVGCHSVLKRGIWTVQCINDPIRCLLKLFVEAFAALPGRECPRLIGGVGRCDIPVGVGTLWRTTPIAILPDDPAALREESLRLIFHLTARLLPVPIHVTQGVLLLILFLVLLFDGPTYSTTPILCLLLSTSNSCLFLFPQRCDYVIE